MPNPAYRRVIDALPRRLVDSFDNAITDARVSRAAQREAAAFAASVRLGRPYYTITPEKAIREWVFTHRSRVTGDPMCGSMSAAGLWLNYGPVTDTHPSTSANTDDH